MESKQMSPAIIIGTLLAQKAVPLAIEWVEQWSKSEPNNPEPKEWLAFLKRPSLYKTYDQQIADAAARHAA